MGGCAGKAGPLPKKKKKTAGRARWGLARGPARDPGIAPPPAEEPAETRCRWVVGIYGRLESGIELHRHGNCTPMCPWGGGG